MSGGGGEPDLVGDLVIGVDQVRGAGLEHRPHRVTEGDRRADVARVPVLVLDAAEQVAGIGKRRHPLAVDEHRVEPDVVEVQMGTRHHVDIVDRETGRREIVQELIAQMRHGIEARDGSVPEARVDDDGLAHGLHHQRVDRERQRAVLVDEVRFQPIRIRGDDLVRVRSVNIPAASTAACAANQCDADVTDLPLHCGSP